MVWGQVWSPLGTAWEKQGSVLYVEAVLQEPAGALSHPAEHVKESVANKGEEV